MAEEKTVTTPIKVEHWYVPREEAERIMAEAEREGEDPGRITSPEGYHVQLTARENGQLFRKTLHLSPTSCVMRVNPAGMFEEMQYQANKRMREMRREIAHYRLVNR